VTGRRRVLIVEDEHDLAWLEQFNLESEGYEVQVALEGRSAIEALRSFEPDLMVLDLMLPHVNGWAVLAETREIPDARRPKVIIVSAVAGASDRARADELGVGRYLAKPFDMDELVRLVGESIGRNGRAGKG
jgi:two-component system alkaline phosphatase synthesis response regulator PhoP